MQNQIILDKKQLMDLLSLTAMMSVGYIISFMPGFDYDGNHVTIESELSSEMFDGIPKDVKEHVELIVNGYHIENDLVGKAGNVLNRLASIARLDANANIDVEFLNKNLQSALDDCEAISDEIKTFFKCRFV